MVIVIRTLKNNKWLKDAGYSVSEEAEIYDKTLQDIRDNARWYLDNIDYLVGYKVSWHKYGKSKQPATPLSILRAEKFERDLKKVELCQDL